MQTNALLMSLAENGERVRNLDLEAANLPCADLSHLSADRLNLRAANLRNASLVDARLGSCVFQDAHLDESNWSNATLRMCVLDGASAREVRFDDARVEDCSAKGADLTRASLRGAGLTETIFERAVLYEANFDDAQGDGVEFRGADLRGASLCRASLDEADFRGADLRGADLSSGRFHDADFRGALLDDTCFAGADLEGALFDEEHVRESEAAFDAAGDLQDADNVLLKALHETISELPSVLATSESPLADFQEQLQQAIAAMGQSADDSPSELAAWVDWLAKMAADGAVPDDDKKANNTSDWFANLQELLPKEDTPVDGIFEHLQPFVDTLEGTDDRPPEEWRSWLKPLVKMTEREETLDVSALLEAVAAVAKAGPPQHSPDADGLDPSP